MTQEPKHVLWAQQIQAWECSQIGQKEFCRQHALSYPQFCYWRKLLEQQRFQWPKIEWPCAELAARWLDLFRNKPHKTVVFDSVS